MIGEIEYTDVFLGTDGLTDPNEVHLRKMYYQVITVILFILFLIFMNIIIMNLLVGLAVDDIKAVQEKAVLKRLAMQVCPFSPQHMRLVRLHELIIVNILSVCRP